MKCLENSHLVMSLVACNLLNSEIFSLLHLIYFCGYYFSWTGRKLGFAPQLNRTLYFLEILTKVCLIFLANLVVQDLLPDLTSVFLWHWRSFIMTISSNIQNVKMPLHWRYFELTRTWHYLTILWADISYISIVLIKLFLFLFLIHFGLCTLGSL